jgi:undecaprenyl-phosphate 4-deoxy-4-formamido-L-arabinose transferase
LTGPELSVVIPVYRSAETLPSLVERLLRVLKATAKSFEIVFVEDGSGDDSWEVLAGLQRSHPDCIIAVQLMRNYGQHNALMCGFQHARGEYVITMDDDLQNPPEEIPKLLTTMEATGADLVYGSVDVKKHAAWRNLGSALVNFFFRLVFRSRVTVTSFRAIRRRLVRSILPYSLNFTYIDGLLAWNTQRVAAVPVEHHPGGRGGSSYSLGKLVVLALNLFTNFSLLPLQLVSAIGFLAAGFGLVLGGYYLVQYLVSNISVPGYASIIIAVFVLGGLQLLSLGVMGEYLGRLHLNVNRKPQYTVRRVLGHRARRGKRRAADAGSPAVYNAGTEKCEAGPQ